MIPGHLTVAAAQPPCVPGAVVSNVAAHVRAVHDAKARVVVFPELSLTGYLLDSEPLAPDAAVLRPLVGACRTTGSVALVGAPVTDAAGRRAIAVRRVRGEGVDVVYRKTFLGGEEPAHFAPGPGPVAIEVDGWRIGLGLCKDTGTAEHVRGTARLGIDVYAAGLVHLPDELAEQDARALSIATSCDSYVVFASAAGPAGGGYRRTAGTSTVWAPDGSVLARASASAGDVVRATIEPRRPTGLAAVSAGVGGPRGWSCRRAGPGSPG